MSLCACGGFPQLNQLGLFFFGWTESSHNGSSGNVVNAVFLIRRWTGARRDLSTVVRLIKQIGDVENRGRCLAGHVYCSYLSLVLHGNPHVILFSVFLRTHLISFYRGARGDRVLLVLQSGTHPGRTETHFPSHRQTAPDYT